jgi:hypothetical protein
MPPRLPIWDIEPHTLAKHHILRKYWQASQSFSERNIYLLDLDYREGLVAALDDILATKRGYTRKGPIPSRYDPKCGRVLYIDGFAGLGQYSGGEPGSPVIVLDEAINHSAPIPGIQLQIRRSVNRCPRLY